MQPTSVQWRDLTFATGESATYRILEIGGWENTPPPRYDKTNRARGHGAHSSPVWADERLVTIEGRSWSQDDRDAVLQALKRRMTFDGGEEDLTISLAGLTLTAGAQFLRCDPTLVRDEWGIGRFGWVAQWRCPDPLRYGPPQTAGPVGLPTSGGGLVYPLTYGLDYGTSSSPGLLTLVNEGTADTSVQFTVTGSLPLGFEISSATGQRLTYPEPLFTGDVLTLDTATGFVLLGGTADRRSNLTVADWMQVPAGGSITVRFSSLGGAYDAAATLTATIRPAYW